MLFTNTMLQESQVSLLTKEQRIVLLSKTTCLELLDHADYLDDAVLASQTGSQFCEART